MGKFNLVERMENNEWVQEFIQTLIDTAQFMLRSERSNMTKKPSNKRREASSAGEEMAKSVGSACIKLDFDS